MAWLRVSLTDVEQRVVGVEKDSHPDACVRRRLSVIWLLHCGLKREQAAKVMRIAVSSVQRDVSLIRRGGLEALRASTSKTPPTSELAQYRDEIRKSFKERPARTIAEASQRIEDLTGIKRGLTQVRRFLKGMGLKWQCVRAIPVPPKKTWPNTPRIRRHSSTKS